MTDRSDRGHSPSRAQRIAYGGILSALGWLLLIVARALPTGRFFVLTMASLVVVSAYYLIGFAGACLVYGVVGVLAVIWPGIFSAVMFLLCFGLLPLFICLLRVRVSRTVLRVAVHAVMTVLFAAALLIAGVDNLIRQSRIQSDGLVIGLAVLAFQIFLVVYFQVLDLFERFFLERIKPWVHRR